MFIFSIPSRVRARVRGRGDRRGWFGVAMVGGWLIFVLYIGGDRVRFSFLPGESKKRLRKYCLFFLEHYNTVR
jgi:hypothetical protein